MQNLDEYFTEIRKKISKLEIIDSEDIVFEKFGDEIGRVHGKIFFRDGSVLEFLEMLFLEKEIVRERYRFHWQDKNARLIIRWDNAKHHKNIETFPDHKHVDREDNVESSTVVGFIDVLNEIEDRFNTYGR